MQTIPQKSLFKKRCFRELSGGLVVRFGAFTALAWVQSLVRELRSYKLHGIVKKKKDASKRVREKL